MKKNKFYQLVLFLITLCFLCGSVSAQTEPIEIDKEPAEVSKSENPATKIKNNLDELVHFGDIINVNVVGSTEYDWRGVLTPEGFLDGIEFTDDNVFGLCQSGEKIASEIIKSYSKFLKSPEVKVTIIDRSNRPVSTLLGAVKLPQKFRIKRKVFLSELIVISGGFTENASGEIRILRRNDASCKSLIEQQQTNARKIKEAAGEFVKVNNDPTRFINIKISDLLRGKNGANPQILLGDIVTVLSAEPIYIVGGVQNPGKIRERTRLTVSRAIASAGGLTKSADPERITIFRRVGSETKIIKVDLRAVESDKSEDIFLKAYDVIDVGESGGAEKSLPPVINISEDSGKNNQKLPTRVVD